MILVMDFTQRVRKSVFSYRNGEFLYLDLTLPSQPRDYFIFHIHILAKVNLYKVTWRQTVFVGTSLWVCRSKGVWRSNAKLPRPSLPS